MSNMFASFSQAELLIAGGGALIVLTDIVFALLGPYSFSNVIWTAGAVALVAVLLVRFGRMTLPFRYEAVLVMAGLVAVLGGVRDLLYDLRFIPGRSLEVTYYLGMVGLYVGVVLMGLGAWMLWRRAAT
jgi:hypothetical protein